MPSIGEKVSKLRQEKGWTLKELSAKTGVSVSHISAIENGTRPNPSILRVTKLAKALGESLAYFDDEVSDPQSRNTLDTAKMTSLQSTSTTNTSSLDAMAAKLQTLYDPKTQAFIVSETSRPYVALAMQLAEQSPTQDPSVFLQLIAQFIRDQNASYKST